MVTETKKIIEKWYKILEFPKEFDKEFYDALSEIEISPSTSIQTYDINEQNGKLNLLSFLYMCETLKKQYEEKQIDNEILLDTLKDIVRWAITWSELKGCLYLGEIKWLGNHLGMTLFKLGRLQFNMAQIEEDMAKEGFLKGDKIIEVHIPSCGPLKKEECEKSIIAAKEFFKKYYPDYNYKAFTCHSWLLDTSLNEILSKDSNIIQFQNMFDVTTEDKSDEILRYVFKWDTTRDKLNKLECTSTLAQKVKQKIKDGFEFHESYGILK